MGKPNIFISYSHADEAWKDRLVRHLMPLRSSVALWEDRKIGAGDEWQSEIEGALGRADIAVLLISADFLASEFIERHEVPVLLQRKASEGVHVIPLLIKPCDWEGIDWLAPLQIRPGDARALSAGNEHQINADLAALTTEIRVLALGAENPVVKAPGMTKSPANEAVGGHRPSTQGVAQTDEERISWQEFTDAVDKVIKEIESDDKFTPDLVLSVGRGGAIAGGMVAGRSHALCHLSVDREPNWDEDDNYIPKIIPSLDKISTILEGKSVLCVMAECESGITLSILEKETKEVGVCEAVRTAAIFKRHKSGYNPNYAGARMNTIPALPFRIHRWDQPSVKV